MPDLNKQQFVDQSRALKHGHRYATSESMNDHDAVRVHMMLHHGVDGDMHKWTPETTIHNHTQMHKES